MDIQNRAIYRQAYRILISLYGPDAVFRPGQYEAIEATMLHRRTLVVQRTGWGKSLVYFIATKLTREESGGLTLVVSPLLALMQKQLDAAKKMGLACDVLNSTVKDRRQDILQNMVSNQLDLVLVTPETLFSEDVQAQISKISIGLFVIDEAHCISDWGHDFRLQYARLREIIRLLPPHVPVLATTATANDRVINDLADQLGKDVFVSRGTLARESLWMQVLNIPNKIERYAWMLENIPHMPGSGIIYCLTQRDCDYLSDFLNKNGISARSYYSRDVMEEEKNREAEELFRRNQIKALVATIKLGMGYDKGDIAFVIHYQMPANIVSYYQQIGRAGRNIDQAYVVLMHGQEDEEIIDYFIRTAFPTEKETGEILSAVMDAGGLTLTGIEQKVNISRSRMDKAITFLQNDGFLYKEDRLYYVSPKPYVYNRAHYDAVTVIRRREMEQMKTLVRTKECYSQFIINALDDPAPSPCGHCANCLGQAIFPEIVSFSARQAAAAYVDKMVLTIEPRKRWPAFAGHKAGIIRHQNMPGICLSKYGDPGYGELVRQGKYARPARFSDELVGKSASLLLPLIQERQITHVVAVPSLRSGIVTDFVKRLAGHCGLIYLEALKKKPAEPQKTMENSAYQCKNAFESFSIREGIDLPERILLVDDIVDSRWTMTVCGSLLMEHGCRQVYPFALADSSHTEV